MHNVGLDDTQLESRFPGEISITSDNSLMAESEEKIKSLLRIKEK